MENPKKQQIKEVVITFILIIILTTIGFFLLKNHAEKEGRELMSSMDKASKIQTHEGMNNCVGRSEKEVESLVILNNIIQNHKEQHETTFLKLYTYQFVSMKLFLIFSILSALTIFVITHSGWKNTTNYVKALFLFFTAISSLFGLSLSSFDQKVGIHRNGKAFINYDNLQKQLVNYCATGANIEGDSISFVKLHAGIMKKTTELHDFYLDFDKTELNMKDALDLNKSNE
ncbi:hypothetical protein [Kordia zhangzhouensis]|uniref:hypothetical protein n=1 Tax=Kordia zhangzhouensis TaxID=1620405 RepID=UPI0006296EF4|nr:hypothetical protein [Kordia zhangzhouensis]